MNKWSTRAPVLEQVRTPASLCALRRPAAERLTASARADDLRWCSRFVLVAVVLAAGYASALLLHGGGVRDDLRLQDRCVVAATVRATAFAAVLGDDRPIAPAFAERACRKR